MPSAQPAGSMHILSDADRALLAEERGALTDLATTLARFEAPAEERETLRTALRRIDELFLIVVAGEFNAGKSAVINALLSRTVAAEGVTPTTSHIQVIKHPDNASAAADLGLDVVTADAPVLRHLDIVDTPGTNAIQREHERITHDFLPRADLVLFVTSADRPFTESERAFLESIQAWGKKIVVVINKVDILLADEDVDRVEAFVVDNARALLGFAPAVFPVSARRARAAQEAAGEPEAWEASRFAALEHYVAATLDESERLRLKLASPLGVGSRLAASFLAEVERRGQLLADDLTALDDIERQLAVYREDMEREFHFRLADVDNVLHEFEARGIDFFDDTLRLARVFDLVQRAKVKAEFQRRVIAEAPRRIEKRVGEIIDWMVEREVRQWRAVTELAARRRAHHEGRVLGPEGTGFEYDRARLLDTVGRAAQRTVDSYDRDREAERMAESLQMAVAGTAVIEVGALGLGALVTALATSTVADVSGIVAAGAIAALGLFVIPARRRAAKDELRRKLGELRERLMAALSEQFDREVEGGVERIREAVAPYTRFVRAERGRLDEMREELTTAADRLDGLRRRVEELGRPEKSAEQ